MSRVRLVTIAAGAVLGIATLGTAIVVAGVRPLPVPVASPSLFATLVLSTNTVRAGGEISGKIVVENPTGRDIHLIGCHGIFEVLLASNTYHPGPAWLDCLQRITIPTGRSRYSAAVRATYSACGQAAASGGIPACLPPPIVMPPLPRGAYWATTFEDGNAIPLPARVKVTVT